MKPATGLSRRTFLGAAAAPLAAAPAARPNIVFIFSDDHHWQCLGANGNPHIRTPHLDRLAARGVNFTNGIITTSQCAPSRGIMLSGLETFQSGLLSNGQTSFREGFEPTVVEQMRVSGYDTVLIGKWHIRPTPRACGFAKAPLWLAGGSSKYQDPELRRGHSSAAETVRGHITDLFTNAACEYLESARSPFLLWLTYNAPHTPWYASGEFRRHYEGKDPAAIAPPIHPPGGKPYDWVTYYSVITHLDEAVGKVADTLDRRKLWENTLVLFVGDNGFMCGSRGITGKVVPYEESIRVPFLAAGGPVRKMASQDMPASSIDLPATWLDYAGVRPAYPLSGHSLRKVLETGVPDRDAAFATWADGRPNALATGRAVEPFRLVRTLSHKLIRWESGREELYAHRQDPAETRNLAGEAGSEALLRDLRGRLAARMKETSDPALSWPAPA